MLLLAVITKALLWTAAIVGFVGCVVALIAATDHGHSP